MASDAEVLQVGEILLSLKNEPVVHSYRHKAYGLSVITSATEPMVYSTESPMATFAKPPNQSPRRCGTPDVQLADLRACFNLPIAEVARRFGICATLLKKICRKHGIQRWPHRQIRSLEKSIAMLRDSLRAAKGSNQDYISKKIAAFEYTLECIIEDPNTAAKGISAGRLASPSSDDMARRRVRQRKKPLPSAHAGLTALSRDSGSESDTRSEPKDAMSMQSILC